MADQTLIYIADDHKLMAEGFSNLLSDIGYSNTRMFENGLELLRGVYAQKPDLIFLDINMPQLDGIQTLLRIKEENLSLNVIILTMLDELSLVNECINLGAKGFLHKTSNKEEIGKAIECVFQDEFYISPSVQQVRAQQRTVKEEKINITLTAKEYEILKHICNGDSPKEIANSIFLSYRTVEIHKKNIMQKLNINNVAKLVSFAFKHNLVN
jgi:DNA-binding NarL/FixJ family response regulator